MIYDNIVFGNFIARPNRFAAHVQIDGQTEICHIKNTGRLKELLVPGALVSAQQQQAPRRKTAWDLIAVQHQGHWVNIDSQAPNKVFGHWVMEKNCFGKATLLRPEVTYGNSRFDWYIEIENRRVFVEVKGVTLAEDGVARFPGAPTERGVKHLHQLTYCLSKGYEALFVLVVKRNDVYSCGPNDIIDPAFGIALREAARQGVQVLGFGCDVTANSLTINRSLNIIWEIYDSKT